MKAGPQTGSARRREGPATRHITPLWRILLRLGLLASTLLAVGSVGHAQEDEYWDGPFREPQYLVHITETGTMDGPVERDDYILYPVAPEDGVLLTADGYGGYYINEAELAGGPFRTRREVCAGAQGIPQERLSLGFSCSAMTGPGSCAYECQSMNGPNAEGTMIDGKCSCSCQDGYEPDDSLVCIPTQASCDRSCREYHGTDKVHGPEAFGRVVDGICNCTCQKGYVPDETLTCVKEKTCQQDCEDRWGQQVEGRGKFPNCQCECKKGYDRSTSTSTCLESCPAQCKRQYGWQATGSGDPAQPCNCTCLYPYHWNDNKTACIERARWVDTGAGLEAFLRSRGYTESHCHQGGTLPPGSVKIWDLQGSPGAHSSVVLSQDRQIHMGNRRDAQGTLIAAIEQPTATNPKADPQASQGTYQLQKVLCPPPGTYINETKAEELVGTPRYGEKANDKTDDWNCHGFSGALVRTFVETLVRIRPDTNLNWDQVLQIGAVHGHAPITIRTPQGTWSFKSEFAIEVEADGTTVVHLFEGQADYEGSGQAVSLSPGEMVTVAPDGLPTTPVRFSKKAIDAWWEDLEPEQSTSPLAGQGGIAAGLAAGLGLLAGATFLVARHRAGRRRTKAPVHATPHLEPSEPHPRRSPARHAEPWGSLSVIVGQAKPQILNLDRAVVVLGRSAGSDLVLDDKIVSRRHAEIHREGDTVMLHDLNSTNGTLVNGRRITGPSRIRPGDVISLGRTKVVWKTATRDPSAGNRGRLILIGGQSEPSELELSRSSSVSIGRSRDNDIVIKGDALTSRRHAEIRQSTRGHEILDLDSTNGVFVNGQKIGQACLQSGDRIRLSSTEFLYHD